MCFNGFYNEFDSFGVFYHITIRRIYRNLLLICVVSSLLASTFTDTYKICVRTAHGCTVKRCYTYTLHFLHLKTTAHCCKSNRVYRSRRAKLPARENKYKTPEAGEGNNGAEASRTPNTMRRVYSNKF